jgi:predicted lipase
MFKSVIFCVLGAVSFFPSVHGSIVPSSSEVEKGINEDNWREVLHNATLAPETPYEADPDLESGVPSDSSKLTSLGKDLFWYAAAVYCNVFKSNLMEWNCGYYCDNAPKGNRVVYKFHNKVLGTEGLVAVNENDRRILVVFEGSFDAQDWLVTNIRVKLTNLRLPNKNYEDRIQVHTGFQESYLAVSGDLMKVVQELVIELYPDYDVVVLGHSLGGSMSTLFAMHLREHLNFPTSRMQVYTYGQPRVGNNHFANYYNSLDIPTVRFVNEKDIVPHIPFGFMGYEHHPQEAWWTRGSLQRCSSDNEDPSCSNSMSPTFSVLDHARYFGITVNPLKCRLP